MDFLPFFVEGRKTPPFRGFSCTYVETYHFGDKTPPFWMVFWSHFKNLPKWVSIPILGGFKPPKTETLINSVPSSKLTPSGVSSLLSIHKTMKYAQSGRLKVKLTRI